MYRKRSNSAFWKGYKAGKRSAYRKKRFSRRRYY